MSTIMLTAAAPLSLRRAHAPPLVDGADARPRHRTPRARFQKRAPCGQTNWCWGAARGAVVDGHVQVMFYSCTNFAFLERLEIPLVIKNKARFSIMTPLKVAP
ncbi:MAG: hypothetical protein VX257_07095 [Planctomycetota bacterium]|nr:hypothetical protein [Planctomycetota bacterium]